MVFLVFEILGKPQLGFIFREIPEAFLKSGLSRLGYLFISDKYFWGMCFFCESSWTDFMEETWKTSHSGFSDIDLGLDGLALLDGEEDERQEAAGIETTDILVTRGKFFFGTFMNSNSALTCEILSYK